MIILKQFAFFVMAISCLPIAFFYRLVFKKNNIWLIGENAGECLHDNGYHFFNYCTSNRQGENDVYFVVSRNSINLTAALVDSPWTIYYGTYRHILLFLCADVCVFTHTYRDVAYKSTFILFASLYTKIFIQHGVLGFGDIKEWYKKNIGYISPDLFLISAKHEYQILRDHFPDVPKDSIICTGLPRYDVLRRAPANPEGKTILYIPTSRDWAVHHAENSTFLHFVQSLLRNPKISEISKEKNVNFQCYLHKKMRACFKFLDSESEFGLIQPGEETVKELIASSSLLITDYSSVSWDAFYLGIPVLFYQFDQAEYLSRKGSYVDYDTFNFGEVVKHEIELVEKIERYCESNFEELEIHSSKRKKYFMHFDQNCSERLYDEIVSRTLI